MFADMFKDTMTGEESIVYLGTWRDYEYSIFHRFRTTLTSQAGKVLSNLLVMFVTFAGIRCWVIAGSILHS